MDDRASEVWGSGHHVRPLRTLRLGADELTTLLTYGRTTYRSERDVVFGDLQRRAEAEFATTDWMASVESRFPLSSSEGMNIEPVVSLGRYSADYRSFQNRSRAIGIDRGWKGNELVARACGPRGDG